LAAGKAANVVHEPGLKRFSRRCRKRAWSQVPSLCSSVKAPDAVREFTRGESDVSPLGFDVPNIEAVRLVIFRIFDLDGRLVGRMPYVIKDVDPVDQELLPLNTVADVSPDECVHFRLLST
jgi:hypothetical protein